MRALDKKRRRFPGAKAVHHSKVAVAEKERLLHVFSELSPELVLQRLKDAMQCSDLVLSVLSLIFDEETFPPKSLLTCTRCGSEFVQTTTPPLPAPCPTQRLIGYTRHPVGLFGGVTSVVRNGRAVTMTLVMMLV